MRLTRSILITGIAATAVLLAVATVSAQEFPVKPVTLMHGFGAGGNADTMARILAEAMSEGLKQRVVVEAKPGAAGTIASEAVAKAAPDGHTLVMLTAAHATTANLNKSLKYDPLESFAMLSSIAVFPYVIAVRKDHPFQTLDDLIRAAREKPGTVSFTSVGVGSVPHLTGELLAARAGVSLNHIPYRGGTAPMADVLGGRVDVLIDTQTVSMPHIRSGNARGLAVTSGAAWAGTPGVPIAAGTLPGFEVMSWIGVATTRGTPDSVLARLNAEINRVLGLPTVAGRLRDLGAEVRPSSADAMRTLVKTEIERWGTVIRNAKIEAAQ
jgi:tripartite-type tricarboxylate transporter receptor subunit TctC